MTGPSYEQLVRQIQELPALPAVVLELLSSSRQSPGLISCNARLAMRVLLSGD